MPGASALGTGLVIVPVEKRSLITLWNSLEHFCKCTSDDHASWKFIKSVHNLGPQSLLFLHRSLYITFTYLLYHSHVNFRHLFVSDIALIIDHRLTEPQFVAVECVTGTVDGVVDEAMNRVPSGDEKEARECQRLALRLRGDEYKSSVRHTARLVINPRLSLRLSVQLESECLPTIQKRTCHLTLILWRDPGYRLPILNF